MSPRGDTHAKPNGNSGAASNLDTRGYCGEGGSEAYRDDSVEIKTGVMLKNNGEITPFNDAISIKVRCTKDPHVVQFIYREIIGADGEAKKRSVKTAGGRYETTSDPKNPAWNTDSAAKPTAYYEAAGAARTDADSLTIFDQPGLTPGAGETWRATFKSYLICDGKVIREVTWVRSQEDGESPQYKVGVACTDKLPHWANDQLRSQGYDLLP